MFELPIKDILCRGYEAVAVRDMSFIKVAIFSKVESAISSTSLVKHVFVMCEIRLKPLRHTIR